MAYSLSYSKAILVLVFISDKTRRGETEFISTRVISDLLDIPRATLAVIFNNLLRAGILESKEGIKGGVRIARAAKRISLLDILTAIESEKSLFQTDFHLNVSAKRPDSVKRAIVSHLRTVEADMKADLRKVSLSDILKG